MDESTVSKNASNVTSLTKMRTKGERNSKKVEFKDKKLNMYLELHPKTVMTYDLEKLITTLEKNSNRHV
jgi:hypothetical protein